jgi:transcription antitermination protein NusB
VSSAAPRKKPTSPTSRSRSRGRELALKYLYQADVRRGDVEPFDAFAVHQEEGGTAAEFARFLAEGVLAKKPELDQAIAQVARNWSISRMPVIDRNILRIGTFELLGADPPPRSVVINEAIELAKRFSTADSGKFINGILDKIGRAGEPPVRKEA